MTKIPGLCIRDLKVSVDDKPILEIKELDIPNGEIHAIMGPNGAGKSTLSSVLAGHPKYKVDNGTITYNGKDILAMPPNERAKLGIFLAFQSPVEIPGVNFGHFLYSIAKARDPAITPIAFKAKLDEALKELSLDRSFVDRDLNVGFSGGEKKRAEVLQILLTKPKLLILDETDSGLDVDALKIVGVAISKLRGPDFSAIIITHHLKILEFVHPDAVHVIQDGKFVDHGGFGLAELIEKAGFSK